MENRRNFLITGAKLAACTGFAKLIPSKAFPQIMNVCSANPNPTIIANSYFEIEVMLNGNIVHIRIRDIKRNFIWAEGNYTYSVTVETAQESKMFSGLKSTVVRHLPDRIIIIGLLGEYEIEHEIIACQDATFFSEQMKITSRTGVTSCVTQLHTSFCKKVSDADGNVLPGLANDKFQAVPFLRRADDEANSNGADYSMRQVLDGNGFVFQTDNIFQAPRRIASRNFISEGWGWTHGDNVFGIFSFNQDNMIFSTLSCDENGMLHFGGFHKAGLNLSILERFEPASTIYLGLNRFYHISGGYNQIAYQYRNMLDEMGCRFPADYNPPVHWNQLYNMNNAWNERDKLYTRANLMHEAGKAKAHSCQALYLDPGWDTAFGSFHWGTARLGECKDYVEFISNEYGLKTALHTPMPPWSCVPWLLMGPSPIESWPASSARLTENDKPSIVNIGRPAKKPVHIGPKICMGSRQFLEEAENRLLGLCEAGVSFLMFDGTWWNGTCNDASHGHPIPYLYEDHMDACIELTRRIHLKYPKVIIEMHDMMNGGSATRATPVYYKYGLPGSYDENWGFELMWHPLEDIKKKSGLAMYYYNLGCNVPLYLHVNTSQDNENNIMLWWFASTARHLGIGGDCPDPKITEKHQEAMKLYILLQEFFKSGEFYGINEEIHFHTLPEKNQSVVNIFRLSENPGTTSGTITLSEIGLDPGKKYVSDKEWLIIEDGQITIGKTMKAWDADLATIK